MAVYLIQVVLILLLGLFIRPSLSNTRRKSYFIIIFTILTVVSGIRAYSVGADTRNYVWMFNHTETIDASYTRIETGFIVFLKILHVFSDNPRLLLVVSSIICVGTACLFSYRLSRNPVMSMLLYVLMGAYFTQMNVMRQAMALSLSELSFLIILSEETVSRKRVLHATIPILFAITIHTISVVVFIPFIILIRGQGKAENANATAGRVFLMSIAISVIGFLGYSIVMFIAVKLFPMYAKYFSGRWSDSNYFGSLFSALIAIVFALAGVFIFDNKQLNKTQRFAAIMIGFSIIFSVLSMRMEIWNRMAGMFSIYTFLLWVPEFTSEIQKIEYRWIVNGTVFFSSLAYMLVVLIFRPEWTRVVPYIIGN